MKVEYLTLRVQQLETFEVGIKILRLENVSLTVEHSELDERLIREQNEVLVFAFKEEVPFTNNLDERDIRPEKVKQEISKAYRSFLRLLTKIEKQNP